jgi:RNA polymerase sigma factor (TIGR02999 family)
MKSDASPKPDLSALLHAWGEGDEQARQQLFDALYDDLKACAARHLRRERVGHTLHTTALVNEACLRLMGQRAADWQGRGHFMAIAATAMRRVLVDHARARAAEKRGGDLLKLSIDVDQLHQDDRAVDVLSVHEALEALATFDSDQARIVELRFFGGYSIEETAVVVNSSPATVKREWDLARAWLYRRLADRATVSPVQ